MTCQKRKNYNDVESCPYLFGKNHSPACMYFKYSKMYVIEVCLFTRINEKLFPALLLLLLRLEGRWMTAVQMNPQDLEMWFWNCCHLDQNGCSRKIGLHLWGPILDKFGQKKLWPNDSARVHLDYFDIMLSGKVWSFWPQKFTPIDKSRFSQKFWLHI